MSQNMPIIFQYTRAEAIADGVLIDLNALFPDEVREAGIVYPVAITRTAFDSYIALTPMASRMGNNVKGRAWDVLWMLRTAIQTKDKLRNELIYSFQCVVNKLHSQLCQLKSVCGPGDHGEPVITLMEVWED